VRPGVEAGDKLTTQEENGMAKQRAVDKNLQNVVDELDRKPVNAHQANQLQQQKNDRQKQDRHNHDTTTVK
jgi:hypothetical protein